MIARHGASSSTATAGAKVIDFQRESQMLPVAVPEFERPTSKGC